MLIEQTDFGVTRSGEHASLFSIRNRRGMCAVVTDYGAILVSLLVPCPDGVTRELLGYLMNMLQQEMESREFGAELYSMGCLAQILVLINRLAERMGRDMEPRTQTDSVVYRVLSYINEHYSEDLSLDFLANKFFISKYHLSREFNRLVGTSVYRYIIQKRLVMAKQMMSNGIPSATVYQHCGFGDYSNFYRAFKAEYQISPREFVESLRKAEVTLDSPRRFRREQK